MPRHLWRFRRRRPRQLVTALGLAVRHQTVGWEAIVGPKKAKGIPDTRLQAKRGWELFARLPEERQRQILGPAKLAVYRAGAIKLEDVAGFRRDPRWGPVGFEMPLKDIMGAKDAAQYLDTVRRAAAATKPYARGDGYDSWERPRDESDRLAIHAPRGSNRAELGDHVPRGSDRVSH